MNKIEGLMMVGIIAVAGSVMVANRQPRVVDTSKEVTSNTVDNSTVSNAYANGFVDGTYCGAFALARYLEMGKNDVELDQLLVGSIQTRQLLLNQTQQQTNITKLPPISVSNVVQEVIEPVQPIEVATEEVLPKSKKK